MANIFVVHVLLKVSALTGVVSATSKSISQELGSDCDLSRRQLPTQRHHVSHGVKTSCKGIA